MTYVNANFWKKFFNNTKQNNKEVVQPEKPEVVEQNIVTETIKEELPPVEENITISLDEPINEEAPMVVPVVEEAPIVEVPVVEEKKQKRKKKNVEVIPE